MRQLLMLVFGLFLFLDISAFPPELNACDFQIHTVTDTTPVNGDTVLACQGMPLMLAGTGATAYAWEPAAAFDNPNAEAVTILSPESRWYYVNGTVDDVGCLDSFYVEVIDPTFEVNLSRTDTICPGDEVIATFSSSHPISAVSWEPEDSVENPTSLDIAILDPSETTEYIVTATIGNCTVSDTVTVEVVPFSLRLQNPDTIYLCKPDMDDIRVILMPAEADIVWTSSDTTFELSTVGTTHTATVFPSITTDYNVTATFRGCTLSHDIHVRVDSLPELGLIAIPEKDPYCAGDEAIILAADADTLLYPDIEFMWQPMDGQIQDSTNTGNVYVVLQDTTRFVRTVINNACRDSSEITLNVVPPELPLSVTDTTLCPGDQFDVEVLDRDVTDLEWMPAQGLSCSMCFEPTVTVSSNITYMVSAEKDGCPVGNMLNVSVWGQLPIIFDPMFIEACPGDEITVSIDTTGIFNLEISITGNNGLSCTGCPDPVITVGEGGFLQVVAEERLDSFCGAFGQMQVAIPAPEQANGDPIFICPGEDTQIDLSGFDFVNPRLNILNGNLSCTNCLDPVISGLNVPTTLIVTDDNVSPGFCTRETFFPIQVADTSSGVSLFEVSDPSPGQGEIVDITLVTNPLPPAGTVFTWTVNGELQGSNTQSLNGVALNEEINVVTVTWISDASCVITFTDVIVTNPPDHNIPNAFTPNGDEENERFRVQLIGNVQIEEMLVFNRWGQLVYEGTDPNGWDGTYNGEPAPPEVYGYLIRLRFPNGIRTFKGDVTLIR